MKRALHTVGWVTAVVAGLIFVGCLPALVDWSANALPSTPELWLASLAIACIGGFCYMAKKYRREVRKMLREALTPPRPTRRIVELPDEPMVFIIRRLGESRKTARIYRVYPPARGA